MPTPIHIVLLHAEIISRTGGSAEIRDAGLIESALARADASFGDVELYPDVIGKAAAVCHGLVMNHGFVDGNKRVGVAAMLLILRRNGVFLAFTQEELSGLGLDIARGEMDCEHVQRWIKSHIA